MTSVIKHILFATDLREESRHVFHYAVRLAAQLEAELSILYVLEGTPDSAASILKSSLGQDKWASFQESQVHSAKESLISKRSDYEMVQHEIMKLCTLSDKHCAESMFDDVPLMVVQGKIAEKILEIAGTTPCDLIVMGAHAGLFGKKTIGGSTKTVLNKAKVPVIVVPREG